MKLLEKIEIASGSFGVDFYNNHTIEEFIPWFKENTAFDGPKGKAMAKEVLSELQGTDFPTYIAYVWKHNTNSHAALSRDNENLFDFEDRMKQIYPYLEGYHIQISEFSVLNY